MNEIRRLLVVTVAVLAVLGSVPTPALAGDTAGAGSTDATVAIVGGVAPAVASAAVLAADASPENATAPAGSEQADGDDANPPGGNERQSPAANETAGDDADTADGTGTDGNASASPTSDQEQEQDRTDGDTRNETTSPGPDRTDGDTADASPENATGTDATDAGTGSDGESTPAPAEDESVGADDAVAPASGGLRLGSAADGDEAVPVRVYVLLVDADPAHEAALEALGAEVILRSGEHVSAWATPAVVERLRAAPFVVRVGPLPELRPPPQPTPPDDDAGGDGNGDSVGEDGARVATGAAGSLTSEGVAAIGADRLHAEGITGAGVDVGVVDLFFDPSNPEIAANVVAYRSFTDGLETPWTPPPADADQHGTAVAEVVVDVAPDARIHFAQATDPVAFRAALDWLVDEQGVDVVTSSLAWTEGPLDGTGALDRAVAAEWAGGVPVVVAAGNSADKHWRGPFRDADGDGFHEFEGARELASIHGGVPLPAGVLLGATLQWDDWEGSPDAYRLLVFERQPDGTQVLVAEPPRDPGSVDPSINFGAPLPRDTGPLSFAIHRGTEAGDDVVELWAIKAPLQGAVAERSLLSPGTSRAVVAVGAYNHADGRLEYYSSQGPTTDGRRGIDVVSPTRVTNSVYGDVSRGEPGFWGTSAASPHVAGVAALLLQADPTLTPDELERTLHGTARDTGPAGPDPATGYGYLDAYAAVDAVRTGDPGPDPDPDPDEPDPSTYQLVHVDPDEGTLVVDVDEVFVRSDAETMSVRVTYNGDLRDYRSTDLGIYLDTDRDPTTGADLGVGSAVGPDYFVGVQGDGVPGSLAGGVANVLRYDPVRGQWTFQDDVVSARVDLDADVIEVTFRRASVGDPAALHYLVRTIDFENPRGPTFDEVPDLGSSPPSLGWSFADGPITPPDGPVLIGVPSEGAWEVVGTDPDDPIRLDYAALAAQTDGENLFVRLDYNGDYSAASPVRNQLYLDTDGDATTGRAFVGGFGADYSITTFPGVPGAAVERWDPAAADFVSVGRVTYIQSEFAREQQVVGAALSDLRLAEGDAVSFLARLHVPSGAIADQVPDAGRATFVIGGASPPADGDDRFEPNDRPGQETPLATGTYPDLRVAGADVDRFALALAPGDRLTATARFRHADADLDLALLAPGGTRVGVADSTTDDETLAYAVPAGAGGTYVLVVEAFEDAGDAAYALTIAVEGDAPPPTDVPPTGRWFPLGTDEDDPEIPVDLAALWAQDDGERLYLRVGFHGDYAPTTDRTVRALVDADDDPTTGSQLVDVSGPVFGADYAVVVTPAGTTLEAWDPAREAFVEVGDPAYDAPDFDADEHVVGVALSDLGVASPTVVALLVRQNGLVDGRFRLDQVPGEAVRFPVGGGDGAGSDRFEPNDLVGQETPLAPGTYADLRVVGRDLDRFALALAPGDEVTATARFRHADADLDLTLRRPDGFPVAFGNTRTDDETLAYAVPAGAGGTYVLVVEADGGEGDATYALTVAVEGDSREPDDPAPVPAPPFDGPVPGTGGAGPPIDHDGDGRYEDVDGDGRFGFLDVIALLFADAGPVNADPAGRAALDFDGDGRFGFLDVIDLLFRL